MTKNTPVSPPPQHQPRHVRYSARWQARLDATTCAKLEELASALRRKRAATLRYVMQWGLTRTQDWTVDRSIPTSPCLVHLLIEPALMQQVQDAAAIHQVSMAAWLREAMRRITPDDFPASWRAEETAGRSHESGYYRRKFGLRLDDETSRKLERLTQTFHRSAAEVIRQLVAQAHPEHFPQSWHLAWGERRGGGPS